jgi:hypothetical protein
MMSCADSIIIYIERVGLRLSPDKLTGSLAAKRQRGLFHIAKQTRIFGWFRLIHDGATPANMAEQKYGTEL